MVIETPEGLTLVEPAENSSFYIVQENEGQETPPSMTKNVMVSSKGSFFKYFFMVKACCNAVLVSTSLANAGFCMNVSSQTQNTKT